MDRAGNLWGDAAKSAVQKGFDGRFVNGPLAGKTVNVKWFGKRTGMLNINPDGVPDYYLVMTGPKAAAVNSRGQTLPWVITEVFLFDALALVERLRGVGRKLGAAPPRGTTRGGRRRGSIRRHRQSTTDAKDTALN